MIAKQMTSPGPIVIEVWSRRKGLPVWWGMKQGGRVWGGLKVRMSGGRILGGRMGGGLGVAKRGEYGGGLSLGLLEGRL